MAQTQSQAPAPDIFDQLAAENAGNGSNGSTPPAQVSVGASSSNANQSVPPTSTPVPPSPNSGGDGGGDIFDQLASENASGNGGNGNGNGNVSSTVTPTSPTQTYTPATIGPIQQPSSIPAKLEKWADNVQYDIEHGTDLTGVGHVLKAMGAHGVYMGDSQAVGDFMASLPLGLLKGVQGEAQVGQGKVLKGAKNIGSGVLQASTMPSAFIAPEGAEAVSDAAAQGLDLAGNAIGNAASKAASTVTKPFRTQPIREGLQQSIAQTEQSLKQGLEQLQNGFHGSLRDLFDSVAQDAGVKPSNAQSLRQVAADTASAVKAKASAMYKQLDAALGGMRFQTLDEQLSNVRRVLRNSAGIDPDADGKLVERINDLEDAKAAAMEQAKANGVDPKLINDANAAYRQGSALEDLTKHVQASASGLRPELQQGQRGLTTAESVSPAKLSTRANRMYDTGRLQQALGNDRAEDLLRATEGAKARAQQLAQQAEAQTDQLKDAAGQAVSNVQRNRYLLGAGLAATGAGRWLLHLIGQ